MHLEIPFAAAIAQSWTMNAFGMLAAKTNANQVPCLIGQLSRTSATPNPTELLLARAALGLTHDLNNLLGGTLLYCGLLKERVGADHDLSNYVEQIRSTGSQASELIDQLLNLGRSKPEGPESCDVSRSVVEMLDLLSRLAGEAIEVGCEIETGIGRAAISSIKLQRVLLNLVLNARDAMPEGGRIRIRVSRPRPEDEVSRNGSCTESSAALPLVLLDVTDTGHGMDAATRAHAKEMFFTTKTTGLGIGLSAVQEVISACGGRLSFANLLSGTSARVLLPCVPDIADAFQTIALQHPATLFNQERIQP